MSLFLFGDIHLKFVIFHLFVKKWGWGKLDGLWTKWHENGQKEEEGTFKDGELIEWTSWDKYGNEL